jgi:glycerophosphoryl diester phosphodiesterase
MEKATGRASNIGLFLVRCQTMIPALILIAGCIGYLINRTKKTPIPQVRWKRFQQPGAVPLDPVSCHQLQGIYTIGEGKDFFGESAVLKWSYTVENSKTLYHLSFFCSKYGAFIICEGKSSGNDILLKGYWRKLSASQTGTVQLIIAGGVSRLHKQQLNGDTHPLSIKGRYGRRTWRPNKPITLFYEQPIPDRKPLDIIAHRGGARNVDFLSVSENSLEMFKMTARLGATGVEIDVRITKDNIPVIIHDSFLSLHNIKESFYGGLVSSYTLAELKRRILKKGGQVPTLQEALHTILYCTPLNLVWLDIKKECDLREIRKLQQEYLQKARDTGRDLRILLGIPDKTILNCFLELEDHLQLPSLTELEPEIAEAINAEVWAPQYTGGFQKEKVQRMQAQGRKVFVWSLDHPLMIELYLAKGGFDGVVTNAPPVMVHIYYTSKEITAVTGE